MGSGCSKSASRNRRSAPAVKVRNASIVGGKSFDPSTFGGRGSFGSSSSSNAPGGGCMTPDERRQFIENAFTNLNIGNIQKSGGRKFSLTEDDISKLMEVLEVKETKISRDEIDAVLSNLVTHRRGTKRVSYTPIVKSIPEIQSDHFASRTLSDTVSLQSNFRDQHQGSSTFTMESTTTLDPWQIADNIHRDQKSETSRYSAAGASVRGNAGSVTSQAARGLPRSKSPTSVKEVRDRMTNLLDKYHSPHASESELRDLVDEKSDDEFDTSGMTSSEDLVGTTEIVSPSEFRRLITDFVSNPPPCSPVPSPITSRRSSTKEQRQEAGVKKRKYYY